jgi:hypothetical protein
MKKNSLMSLAGLVLATGIAQQARAGEVYTGVGTHGVMLGYAEPLSPLLTLRADFASFGSRNRRETEEGIDYNAKLTYQRAGLFADWFPAPGAGFRLTAGVTFNNMKMDLNAVGNGNPVTIGNTTFNTDSTDRFNVKIELPRTTPYFGLGYGHQLSSGWGFVFDLGASIGKARLSETHSGNNLGNASQADIDAELAELRDGVGKVKAIPMIAIGFNYRF